MPFYGELYVLELMWYWKKGLFRRILATSIVCVWCGYGFVSFNNPSSEEAKILLMFSIQAILYMAVLLHILSPDYTDKIKW